YPYPLNPHSCAALSQCPGFSLGGTALSQAPVRRWVAALSRSCEPILRGQAANRPSSGVGFKEIAVTKLNRRSHFITEGVARSPNRAMLRAVGFGDGDFEKPIIGVANGHSTMNPCNAGIQPLVDNVMVAVHEAGAMPQVFGFPTVTDGIGMGTEG